MAFSSQGSLVKLRKYSIYTDSKQIELQIRPIAGFQGDKVLMGWKNYFGKRNILMKINNVEEVNQLRSDRLYPIVGKGLIGTIDNTISIQELTSRDPRDLALKIAFQRIEQLENMITAMAKTNAFLSKPVESQIRNMINVLKETKKLVEPANMDYFQFPYPQEPNVIRNEEEG
jgi:hypothetical protein